MDDTQDDTQRFLREAIRLARGNMEAGGRPFGAVVVKDGRIVATGVNTILADRDPTAHAEMSALRAASRALGSPDLSGCAVYASGNPCPMCMAAMRMSGVNEVAYAYSNDDGEPYGLSTAAGIRGSRETVRRAVDAHPPRAGPCRGRHGPLRRLAAEAAGRMTLRESRAPGRPGDMSESGASCAGRRANLRHPFRRSRPWLSASPGCRPNRSATCSA